MRFVTYFCALLCVMNETWAACGQRATHVVDGDGYLRVLMPQKAVGFAA